MSKLKPKQHVLDKGSEVEAGDDTTEELGNDSEF